MKRISVFVASLWIVSIQAGAQITWSDTIYGPEGGYPRMAELSDGSHLLGVDFNGIRVYKSTDKGDSWSSPTGGAPAVADPASANEHVGNVFPLEVGNGDILIAFRHYNDTDTYDASPDSTEFFNIGITKSSDGGATWNFLSNPINSGLPIDSNDGVWEPFLYKPSSNEVWCIYCRQNNGRDTPPLYVEMKRSYDYGATWGAEETIIGNSQIGNSTAGMPALATAANGDLIVVAEVKSPTSNLFAIGMVRSTNNGATWGAMTIIYEAPALTDGYGAGAPYIAKLADGSLMVSYQYGGFNTGLTSQMGYITSDDNGVTWSENIDLFEPISLWNALFVDTDGVLFGMTSGVQYKKYDPADDAIAYWRFEEGSVGAEHAGDWDDFYHDYSGNGNHMSSWWDGVRPMATSERPFTMVPQTGETNAIALAFDGFDELGSFANTNNTLNSYTFINGWTVECIFKLDLLDIPQILVAKQGKSVAEGAPIPEPPIWLKVLPWNNHLEVLVTDNSNTFHTAASLEPLEADKWYSAAATYNKNTGMLELYLKGQSDATYILQGSVLVPDGVDFAGFDDYWTIGRGSFDGDPSDFLNGKIDEVRISSRALEPVKFISSNFDESTVAYWRFEEGEVGVEHTGDWDNFYHDYSGNGNDMSSWWDGVRPMATNDRPFTTVQQTGAANYLALAFDGADEIGSFPIEGSMVNSYAFTNGWTIEASFKLNALDLNQTIVAKQGNGIIGEAPFWMKILPWNNHVEVLFFDDNNNMRVLASDAPVVAGKWYNVAASYNNAEMKLYLKGESDTNYVLQGAPVSFSDGANLAAYDNYWTVGRGSWFGGPVDYLDGIIDEVRISNVALDSSKFIDTLGITVPAIGNIKIEVLPGADRIALTWDTSELFTYTLMEKNNLMSPTWSTNQFGIAGGVGSVTVTTTVDTVQTFYKAISE